MEDWPEYQLLSRSSADALRYWTILLSTLYSWISSRIWLPLEGSDMVTRLKREVMSPDKQYVHLFVFSWTLK